MSIQLDKATFKRRLERLYDLWQNTDAMQNVSSLLLLIGSSTEEAESPTKGTLLQIWLFGYEFPDTVMLLTKKGLQVIASQKKLDILGQLQSDSPVPLVLHVRTKEDKNKGNFGKIVAAMNGGPVGIFKKDRTSGNFLPEWHEFASEDAGWAAVEKVDVSIATSYFMGTKEESELKHVRDAATVASHIMRTAVVNKVENVIQTMRKVTHMNLADELEAIVKNPSGLSSKNIDKQEVESAYTPIIQSGGVFDLRPSATSNDELIKVGTIVVAIGAIYRQFFSNIARTFLVNPTKRQSDNYKFLLELQEYIASQLVPGASLASVFAKGTEYVERKRKDLLPHLTSTFGFGIGMEFRESSLIIDKSKTRVVEPGMVFNLAVGFKDLRDAAAEPSEVPEHDTQAEENYSLFVADMMLVPLDGNEPTPAFLTKDAPFKLADVSHILKDLESKDEKRRRRQNQLLQRIITSKEHAPDTDETATTGKHFDKSVAYKSMSALPNDPTIAALRIYVDMEHRAVVLPINGYPVAVHINHIKSVSKTNQSDYMYLRINFAFPTQAAMGENSAVPKAVFMGDLSYRSKNFESINAVDRDIKALQKKAKTEAAEKREAADLVEQEDLQLASAQVRPLQLRDLKMRPALGPRGSDKAGVLVAHTNGFRYSTGMDHVDVIYSNIKHAILQQCKNENVVIIHLHLNNPILIGKKKQKDVQFYVEVVGVDDLKNTKRSGQDRDEFLAEQRERELKNRYNEAFAKFAQKVQEQTHNAVKFDAPERGCGFFGVANRGQAFITPGTHCLFNVTEQPQFVVTLDEIELVHLERVQHSLKSFDMVIIYKDYTRPVTHITAIPTNYIDTIRDWLDAVDIYNTSGAINLNWSAIMKQILENPKAFIEDGAWSLFLGEEEEEDGDDSEDEDSDFEDDFSDSDADASEDYSSEDISDDDDDSDASLDSGEESGKDWDELEEEAMREEEESKKRRREEDDDEGQRKKKRVNAPPPKKSGTIWCCNARTDTGCKQGFTNSKTYKEELLDAIVGALNSAPGRWHHLVSKKPDIWKAVNDICHRAGLRVELEQLSELPEEPPSFVGRRVVAYFVDQPTNTTHIFAQGLPFGDAAFTSLPLVRVGQESKENTDAEGWKRALRQLPARVALGRAPVPFTIDPNTGPPVPPGLPFPLPDEVAPAAQAFNESANCEFKQPTSLNPPVGDYLEQILRAIRASPGRPVHLILGVQDESCVVVGTPSVLASVVDTATDFLAGVFPRFDPAFVTITQHPVALPDVEQPLVYLRDILMEEVNAALSCLSGRAWTVATASDSTCDLLIDPDIYSAVRQALYGCEALRSRLPDAEFTNLSSVKIDTTAHPTSDKVRYGEYAVAVYVRDKQAGLEWLARELVDPPDHVSPEERFVCHLEFNVPVRQAPCTVSSKTSRARLLCSGVSAQLNHEFPSSALWLRVRPLELIPMLPFYLSQSSFLRILLVASNEQAELAKQTLGGMKLAPAELFDQVVQPAIPKSIEAAYYALLRHPTRPRCIFADAHLLISDAMTRLLNAARSIDTPAPSVVAFCTPAAAASLISVPVVVDEAIMYNPHHSYHARPAADSASNTMAGLVHQVLEPMPTDPAEQSPESLTLLVRGWLQNPNRLPPSWQLVRSGAVVATGPVRDLVQLVLKSDSHLTTTVINLQKQQAGCGASAALRATGWQLQATRDVFSVRLVDSAHVNEFWQLFSAMLSRPALLLIDEDVAHASDFRRPAVSPVVCAHVTSYTVTLSSVLTLDDTRAVCAGLLSALHQDNADAAIQTWTVRARAALKLMSRSQLQPDDMHLYVIALSACRGEYIQAETFVRKRFDALQQPEYQSLMRRARLLAFLSALCGDPKIVWRSPASWDELVRNQDSGSKAFLDLVQYDGYLRFLHPFIARLFLSQLDYVSQREGFQPSCSGTSESFLRRASVFNRIRIPTCVPGQLN
ncbi:hypothetical protein CAOG_07608 [Capsaspora owczarzaki ATCC 30864]|uniref:hypothetical protein n=1 Tax=Capsaspora owczarzaki (strain ATCC 30864) TaxID=595528 RepID=UPI0001FE2C0D|nr:hypothetical protein CAOG_07608 [Capsaspora owczarzaki ATCC 30864]|eukprot:XP_004343482.1 hypothetical protein CAOG_07608 [Capsaspora owczarzaki ATCC 30864]